MANVSRETEEMILKGELERVKQAEYLLSIRARVAKKLGDTKRLETITPAMESTLKEIDILEEELKKCQTDSQEPK